MTDEDQQPLPRGWEWASLTQIAEVKGGITKGQKRKTRDGLREVPYLRVANVQRGFLDLDEVKTIEATEDEVRGLILLPGDILFTEGGDRDKLGRGWVWRGEIAECIHQNHIFRARLRSPEIEPKIISWYGNTAGQDYFTRQGKQTTNLASINLTKLSAFPVPIPPSAEQRRIVAAIEEHFSRLDEGIAALESARARLRRYRASVLKAACEGRLVPTEAELARAEGHDYEPADRLLSRILQHRRSRWEADQLAKLHAQGKPPKDDRWKAKYAEPNPPDTSSLPELPEGWTWAAAAQIAEIQGGIQKQPKRTPKENAYPFLRVANVYRNRLELDDVHRIELFGDELDKLRLQPGDLLIVEGNGSPTEIGRMAIWNGAISDCVHQNHIIRARLVGDLPPSYVGCYWNSPDGSSRVMQVSSSTSGLHTLSVTKVNALPVALPPLAEQHRIVAEVERRLSLINALDAALAAGLKRVERLRQAILKRAFSGRLVPQDPADEPASALLERIRAGGSPPAPKPRAGQGARSRRSGPDHQPSLFD
ncbi:restriction endonuclease subunit S [Tautonia marina]|uniref:restriction endonuclease subunit S n=1 Tax=Tautonia marina TaxID=2653855 RepID=UPI001260D52A|nr:restriction endonuclease subunit S [Tautonia marina]